MVLWAGLTEPSEVDYNVAYTSIAAGDTTFIATNWQPLHDDMYRLTSRVWKLSSEMVLWAGLTVMPLPGRLAAKALVR
jgi:ABC-type proline/glycine betaine transport system substrate-binding protein